MNKTRIVSLLLSLIVLISCLPVTSASAASTLTLSGVWQVGSSWLGGLDEGRFLPFSINVDAYVLVNGIKAPVTSIFIDDREPEFLGGSTSSSANRYFCDDGDHYADDGCIYFNTPVIISNRDAVFFFTYFATQLSKETYALIIDGHEEHSHTSPWMSQSIVESTGTTFECSQCSWELVWTPSGTGTFAGFKNASGNTYFGQCIFSVDAAELSLSSIYTTITDPDPGPSVTYTSTIDIDGQAFTFSSTTEQPKVVLQVLTSGVIMSYGDQTLYYIYPGNDTFLGLGASPTGDAFFVPGQTYSLAAGDFTFYAIGESAGSAAVSVVVDDETFTFSADEFPVYITVTVTESGCQLTDGERVLTYTYSGEGIFSGLTFEPGSDPVYVVGDQFSVEFRDTANSTCTLYSCFDLEGEGLSGILEVLKNLYEKFVGWLDNSLSIPEITGSLNIVDFGSIKSFFVDAYQGITSLFGLRDLMEDPAGPFAWLLE